MSNAGFDKVNMHKEIDLIQACITRMANNGFLLKGWAVTLCVGIFALADKSVTWQLCLLASFPLMSFWILDAFFLRTERMFRELYNWVILKRPTGDLSHQFDLNPHRFKDEVPGHISIMFSQTLVVFYFLPILIILLIALASATGCLPNAAPVLGRPDLSLT